MYGLQAQLILNTVYMTWVETWDTRIIYVATVWDLISYFINTFTAKIKEKKCYNSDVALWVVASIILHLNY